MEPVEPTHIHIDEIHREISRNEEQKLTLSYALWVNCALHDCPLAGADLSGSTFVRCSFTNVDLYWCHAYFSTFVECTFTNCDLRGSFKETLLLRCTFDRCETGDNNLGGKTEWTNIQEVDCKKFHCTLPIISESFEN
jgi:uncharacterized protein YjbI with pentapeptide repeats